MTPLLSVKDMTHYFGGLRAVHNYNLAIAPRQIFGLIGPNGAGKTTIFNLITGVYTPSRGEIQLENKNIKGLETNGPLFSDGLRTARRFFQHKGLPGPGRTGDRKCPSPDGTV